MFSDRVAEYFETTTMMHGELIQYQTTPHATSRRSDALDIYLR
jgi:hypothetical protein